MELISEIYINHFYIKEKEYRKMIKHIHSNKMCSRYGNHAPINKLINYQAGHES
jgi:hypothetical protein